MRRNSPGLPDPDRHPEFYATVPAKRVVAWLIDWVASAVIASLLLPFTLFLGIFFFPFLVLFVGFFYRWSTLANGSSTWGMRLMAIDVRDKDGLRLTGSTAFWHVALHYGMFLISPALLISAIATLVSSRKQGLHDMVLGTTALNRAL